MVRDLLQFILATRPLAFLVRVSGSLDPKAPSYRDDLRAGYLLAIGAAKEAGDAFAVADQRGWFAPLLVKVPKETLPLMEDLHASLRIFCDKTSTGSLMSRLKPIRDAVSFHINRNQLQQALQQLSPTVQEFHPINPAQGVVDPFLGLLSAQIVEVATEKTSSDLQFLVEEVPHFVAALANFGEQIYNLLLLEQLALESGKKV